MKLEKSHFQKNKQPDLRSPAVCVKYKYVKTQCLTIK